MKEIWENKSDMVEIYPSPEVTAAMVALTETKNLSNDHPKKITINQVASAYYEGESNKKTKKS